MESKFRFHTISIYAGWYGFELCFNDKIVRFNAGYCGDNPLDELINCCFYFLANIASHRANSEWAQDCKYFITLDNEPDKMQIDLTLISKDLIHIHVNKTDDEGKVYDEWDESVSINDFSRAIIDEGFRVLNAFGLCGFKQAWANDTEFSLHYSYRPRLTEKFGAGVAFMTFFLGVALRMIFWG